MQNLYLLVLLLFQISLLPACFENNEISDIDTLTPYPIDKNKNVTGTPDTYKGLPLMLSDTGIPDVTLLEGTIGMVCIGMSNARQECDRLINEIDEKRRPQINSQIHLINCARGGHAIEKWNDSDFDSVLWERCKSRIIESGMTVKQVRVVLHKAANQFTRAPRGEILHYYPHQDSDFYKFKENLSIFSDRVTDFFPGLQAVFTTSRSYGGFAEREHRGEPLSYEEGHALNQWLQEYTPDDEVWFGWGPYIWAPACSTGNTNGSGICYDRVDFRDDGVHPTASGELKIADMWHQKFLMYTWYKN